MSENTTGVALPPADGDVIYPAEFQRPVELVEVVGWLRLATPVRRRELRQDEREVVARFLRGFGA